MPPTVPDRQIHEQRALRRLNTASLAAAVLKAMGYRGEDVRQMDAESREVAAKAGVALSEVGWEWAAVIVERLWAAEEYMAGKEKRREAEKTARQAAWNLRKARR